MAFKDRQRSSYTAATLFMVYVCVRESSGLHHVHKINIVDVNKDETLFPIEEFVRTIPSKVFSTK